MADPTATTTQPPTNLPTGFTAPAGSVINQGQGNYTVPAGGSSVPSGSTALTPTVASPTSIENYDPSNNSPTVVDPATGQYMYSRINPTTPAPVTPTVDANGNPYADVGQSEADVQAAQLATKQSQINDINSMYDKQISDMTAQQNQAGVDRAGNLKALAAFSGLGGSPTAASNDAGNNSTTTAAINTNTASINAARSSALDGVYNTIDANTQAILKAQATNDTDAENTAIANAAKSATAQIQVLAQTVGAGGAAQAWAQVKAADPQMITALEQQSGMSDAQLQLAYNAALPVNQQIKWNLTEVPGYAIGTDSTGKLTSLKIGTPPSGYALTIAPDGTPLMYNKDTGDVKIAPGFTQGQLAKPTTPTDAASTKSATADMAQQLQSVRGSDGYVSPQDMNTARQAWIAEGLSATDFDSEFASLANPNDPGGLAAYGLKAPAGSASAPVSIPGVSS